MKRAPRQRGSITLWLLGLGICLLVLGGMGLDMWSTVVLRSRLVGVAEAIATAAASGLSEEHWRRTGEVRLDPVRADRLGRSLASRHPGAFLLDSSPTISVSPDYQSVTVKVTGSVPLTLLALVSDTGRIEIVASATSRPYLVD